MTKKLDNPQFEDDDEQEQSSQEFEDPIEQRKEMNLKVPYNQLDMQYLQTEPAYGKEATPEFYQRLKALTGKAEPLLDENGKPRLDPKTGKQMYAVNVNYLWDEMGYFTRDIRLGNLQKKEDVEFCEHYLTLAGDCLSLGCPDAFTSAYRRAVGKIELSQSIKGFFRKNQNTLRKEQSFKEESNSSFFGGKRDKESL